MKTITDLINQKHVTETIVEGIHRNPFAEGFQDRKLGFNQNPFPKGTIEHTEYLRGFNHEQIRTSN